LGCRATFASRPKVAASAAKVGKFKQFTTAFMQELDSKDKIAAQLQPVARKFFRRPFAVSGRLPRLTFPLTPAAQVLSLKGLAIMNFL